MAARRLVLLLTLAFLAPAALSLLPAASGHPYHLLVENAVLGSSETMGSDRWIAQSFVAPYDAYLSRASLYVQDRGIANDLTVSLRNDNGGVPAASDRVTGSTAVSGSPGWVDVELNPRILLSANGTYWIVARGLLPQANGHDVWTSGSDLAYPPGTGAYSPDGSAWLGAGTDYAFRVYGYGIPAFTFQVAPVAPTVGVGETVAFRIDFANTGAASSDSVTITFSLPSGLSYVSDNVASIGGTRQGSNRFLFSDVATGSYTFNLTVAAAGGVANGTLASASFSLSWTGHGGGSFTQIDRTADVTILNAKLVPAILPTATNAGPGDLVAFDGTTTNSGLRTAQNVVLAAVMQPGMDYVSSTPTGNYDGPTRTLRWSFPSLAPASSVNVSWTLRVRLDAVDGTAIDVRFRADGWDATGTALPREQAIGTVAVHAPRISLDLSLDRTWAEAGMEVAGQLTYGNTGSASAEAVQLNWTLGQAFELIRLEPAMTATATGDGFVVDLGSLAPGSAVLTARLRVLGGMGDGAILVAQVALNGTYPNGIPLPVEAAQASLELYAPTIELTIASALDRVDAGSTFSLNLTVRNLGRGTGGGWLNLTLPSGVTYVADNASFVATVTAGAVSWRIPSLAGGASAVFSVRLRASPSPGLAVLRATMNVTDPMGSPPTFVSSNAVTVEFAGGVVGLWPWFALLGLAAVPAVLWVRTRGRIEEVFLVSYSGILLAHLSHTVRSTKDRDIVTAMLTAVQDFIGEAFTAGGDGSLRQMDFGGKKLLVQRGGRCYLAVVGRGRLAGLERRMEETLEKVEDRVRGAPDNWSEDARLVEAASGVLSASLLGG